MSKFQMKIFFPSSAERELKKKKNITISAFLEKTDD